MSMCSDSVMGRMSRWSIAAGLGADEGVHQAQIERPLHTEGPAEGPATSRLLQAPGIGMQVSTSAR